MNSKNIPLKLLFFVVFPVLIAGYTLLWGNKVKLGIDLRGGTSMVFEIRTNEKEREDTTQRRDQLKAELAKTTDETKKRDIEKQIANLDNRINELSKTNQDSSDTVPKIIKILKDRVDRFGQYSLEWIPRGSNRFEVRMPAARPETIQAKRTYQDAMAALEAANILPSKVLDVQNLTGEAREKKIKALTGGDEAQANNLRELAKANDRVNAAKTDEDRANARAEFAAAMEKFDAGNISQAKVQEALRWYVSPNEAEAINNKKEVAERLDLYHKKIDELTKAHPSRKAEIEKVAKLYEDWSQSRQTLDDPSDLKRQIAKAGVLEFRIAPVIGTDPQQRLCIPDAIAKQYVEDLKNNGPEGLSKLTDKFRWFAIRDEREGYDGLITGQMPGRKYLLLSNSPDHALLQSGGADTWRLTDAYPTTGDMGSRAVGFKFDNFGAQKFGVLTGNHVNQQMAILLDDEVYSAPNIKQAISDSGVITGRFSDEDIKELVRILNAGSLPARLEVEDTSTGKMAHAVSESTFGPALGEENLRLALKAGEYGLIAVGAFMILYYMFSGTMAVMAMLLNLVFIMGAMSLMSSVFTLPGIAGLILSVGMAVDSNVLIYERLREEQAKGQSVRMALKNAYEHAFRAIIDTHMTTLLTCLILGWVGSEEIRGFAIALGLGVLFNLFTALTFTRWIFQWMLDHNLIKRPLKMLRLIHVPKIDWMAKRWYFWAFSLITGVIGIASLAWQSSNIWGIEFSSGTQAIVRFKDGAELKDPKTGQLRLPNDRMVEDLFKASANELGLAQLRDTARVEQLIDPSKTSNFLHENFPDKVSGGTVSREEWKKAFPNDKDQQTFVALQKAAGESGDLTTADLDKALPTRAYQISTVEENVSAIAKAAAKAFGDAMVQRTAVTATPPAALAGKKIDQMGIALGQEGPAKIDDKLITEAKPDYRADLIDFKGGLVMAVKDVDPAISKSELTQRINEIRSQPDFVANVYNTTRVVELDKAPGTADRYTSFAVLVRPAEPLKGDAFKGFQQSESKLLSNALNRAQTLEATSFGKAIAGETAQSAIMAVILGWVSIIVYLWVRFGTFKWGAAAVICLVHDTVIVVGLVAASGWISEYAFGQALGITSFKIDLTMIAAILTIIGYSVNDTIVVFDRIRENRGKLTAVTPMIINNSVNQTLSRTILTSVCTLGVVFTMYVWGGAGIHSFNFAMLVGILFGTYSSIAVASPLLLTFRQAMAYRVAVSEAPDAAPTQGK